MDAYLWLNMSDLFKVEENEWSIYAFFLADVQLLGISAAQRKGINTLYSLFKQINQQIVGFEFIEI